MSSPLTELVRQLHPGGPEPSAELFDQVWDALRGLLAAEMKRRGTWWSPPRFFGVVGYPTWTAPGSDTDALDELAAECFEFVFVRRLKGLRAQAARKPNVDGLVALAVGHFLFEAQKRNDPLGSRIFEVLRRIVRETVAAEQLVLLAGNPRIRNDSLVARPGDWDLEQIREAEVGPLAALWVQDHVEALVTSSHGALSALCRDLSRDLVLWLDENTGGFRFGNLADALKQGGRAAWASRFVGPIYGSEPEFPLEPSSRAPREPFDALAGCVDRAVDRESSPPKTRRYLERLWLFLRRFAVDEEGAVVGVGSKPSTEDDLPSYRQLSKLLDIPRERVPGLLKTIGGYIQACLHEEGSKASAMASSSTPTSPSSPRDRARASALAALRASSGHSTESSDAVGGPSPGDVVLLPGMEVDGVFWLVIASESRGALRCAPVDQAPWIGPRDVPVASSRDEPADEWVVRRAFETSVEAGRFSEARLVTRLPLEDVQRALESMDTEGRQRVPDDLPAYRDWIDDGPAAAHRLLTETPLLFPRKEPDRSPWKRSPWKVWLPAAVLAFVVAGMGWRIVELERSVARLSEPILDLPYVEVVFDPELRGPRRLEVPEGARRVQIGIVLRRPSEHESYRIDVVSGSVSGSGEVLESVRPPYVGGLSITLLREKLSRPETELRIYGRSGEEEILIGREKIELVASADRED